MAVRKLVPASVGPAPPPSGSAVPLLLALAEGLSATAVPGAAIRPRATRPRPARPGPARPQAPARSAADSLPGLPGVPVPSGSPVVRTASDSRTVRISWSSRR
ncbi:hypothetical protein [Streptomyces sp. MST-110588]|uniref:hypothetical protein n=1 Tax=Streptomyces sp. MST-110588 TaxID=2833628 RepID=UPI001F5C7CB5|nr:hypothetical protein [Streptomyces sp. MST-110588]